MSVTAPDVADSDQSVIFSSDFGETTDQDFNGWPDGWTRRRGPGYPHYVRIELDYEATDDTRDTLHVELNGGAVEVSSPAIPVDEMHGYSLSGAIKTAGLVNDRALLTLTLLDSEKRPLRTYETEATSGTTAWITQSLGPVNVIDGEPRWAIIGLRVDYSGLADLKGSVWFNQLRLTQAPRVRVEPNQRLRLYTDPKTAELTIRVSGLRQSVHEVQLDLLDYQHRLLSTQTRPIQLKGVAGRTAGRAAPPQAPLEYEGHLDWQPGITECGFYWAKASIGGENGSTISGQTCLLVIEQASRRRGQFGWSLDRGFDQSPTGDLIELISKSGIGWLKVPLWSEMNSKSSIELIEQASGMEINCVGMLTDPPADVIEQLRDIVARSAADVFNAPAEAWHPSAESVLVRFGMNVRYWQLGGDNDRSFVGYPELIARLTGIKKELESSGQALHMGVGWDWLEEMPQREGVPLRFVSMSADPPLTPEELVSYLASARNPQLARWVQIEPASLAAQSEEERASALVQQMVAAAAAGADCIYFHDPVHAVAGLIDRDGRPTELFLPWRMAATALTGASYLGTIDLPEGSNNRVFVHGDRALMVAWSPTPKQESLYLGEQVAVCDMFGHPRELAKKEDGSIIPVGPEPLFVTGLHPGIARWRVALKLAKEKLPSIPGMGFDQVVNFTNTFNQAISGRAKLVTPQGWLVQPTGFDFRLNAGEAFSQPVRITLPYGAESGPQRVQVEFEVFADRPYRFEVTRPVEIGLGDITIAVDTQLDASGALEIEQRLTNNTNRPVRFNCSVFARDRRRQQFELVGPAEGQTYATFRLENGRPLIGETVWLRAAEIGGRRIFNYHFTVEP